MSAVDPTVRGGLELVGDGRSVDHTAAAQADYSRRVAILEDRLPGDTVARVRTSGTRGGYAKSPHRRIEILRAAAQALGEVGYSNASVRDIAEVAGISEAGLRHHFPRKVDLLRGVLEQRLADDIAAVPADANAVERLARTLELVVRNAQQRDVTELFTVLSAEATNAEHPAHDYFVQRYEWVEQSFTKVGEELAQQGQLRPGLEPYIFARNLTAVLDGLQLQWLMRPAVDMVEGVSAFISAHVTEDVDLAVARRTVRDLAAPRRVVQ